MHFHVFSYINSLSLSPIPHMLIISLSLPFSLSLPSPAFFYPFNCYQSIETILAQPFPFWPSYNEGELRYDRGYAYIALINSISQMWAIYCLILFYMAFKEGGFLLDIYFRSLYIVEYNLLGHNIYICVCECVYLYVCASTENRDIIFICILMRQPNILLLLHRTVRSRANKAPIQIPYHQGCHISIVLAVCFHRFPCIYRRHTRKIILKINRHFEIKREQEEGYIIPHTNS